MKTLLLPPSIDDLIRLLRAWRFWTLGALLGGLLGVTFYYIAPPQYRARATVVISFNMEKSWQNKPDNELFYYLERESRKVEEVAWADKTLEEVSGQTGISISDLRAGKLQLSQPQDGAWHFYASDTKSTTAQDLASIWATSFTEQIQAGILTAIELDAARIALQNNPNDSQLQAQIQNLEAESLAITPELQISLSQSEHIPVERKNSPGVFALAGAGLFLALSGLLILFGGKNQSA